MLILFVRLQALILVHLALCLELCTCTDTITSTQFIKDPDAIVSNGTLFRLGFFSPVNTTNRYVGILFNVSTTTAIWVANRERPLSDSSGMVTISEDGNIVVLNGQQEILWSSNTSSSVSNSSAQILDSGNLVLRDISNGRIIWESFDHPVDMFVQNMRLGRNTNTNTNGVLTSWKSAFDPAVGVFSGGLATTNIPQLVVWNGSDLQWRSGPWNGQTFIGIPNMISVYLNQFTLVDGRLSFTYVNETLTHYLLNTEGNIVQRSWDDQKQVFQDTWSSKMDDCDDYVKCGSFGICDSRESPICTCLEGFEPKNMEEWSRGNWTGGCVRRVELQCGQNIPNGTEVREDVFLRLTTVKVPDFAEWIRDPDEGCGGNCRNNCSCVAYTVHSGIGCMQWSGGLFDIQQFPGSAGSDLYIRVAYSDLDKPRNRRVIVIAITVPIGFVTMAVCVYVSWKCMAQRKGRTVKSRLLLLERRKASLKYKPHPKIDELPLFTFEKLSNATEGFHLSCKLGQGGFGPVYKGKLPDGQEVAVKRLSKSSGQGMEEFMNEVVVISKLQHRNLVRLLGCCVEREEHMLVYEYMPNRSLDAHLFDPREKEHLKWSTRVHIIEEIGRGLLYLHRDSRLKIIHRDLKASNILLDDELNPKISDFGMARIFGGKQIQANTARVVGTYGYMAPEYAMEGRFSEKSDVYSFGVLLLEIVSGRRNNSFYNSEVASSLLAFTWNLWNEEKIIGLLDPSLSETCSPLVIVRYMHVGLLCVQEQAKDRPNISTVLSMLSSEIADLPAPQKPAFTESQASSGTHSQQKQQHFSENYVTLTTVEGR